MVTFSFIGVFGMYYLWLKSRRVAIVVILAFIFTWIINGSLSDLGGGIPLALEDFGNIAILDYANSVPGGKFKVSYGDVLDRGLLCVDKFISD